MSTSTRGRLLLAFACLLVLGACGQNDPGPPFPVESQQDWRRYLQGTWEHAGVSVARTDDMILSTDSVFYRISFRGDTVEVMNKDFGGTSVNVGHAVCLADYGSPPKFNIEACVRGRRFNVWRQDIFTHQRGDTTSMQRTTASPGTPKAERLAAEMSDALPRLRATARDSLWVGYGNDKGFYLTRQESRGWIPGSLDLFTE